jgi:hypothetical protein
VGQSPREAPAVAGLSAHHPTRRARRLAGGVPSAPATVTVRTTASVGSVKIKRRTGGAPRICRGASRPARDDAPDRPRFLGLLQEAVEYSPGVERAIETTAGWHEHKQPTTASRSVISGGVGAVSPPPPAVLE